MSKETIRQVIVEELNDLFDTPHHRNMATKAGMEKVNYRHELDKITKDHNEFMDVHTTLQERRELLNRVSKGLDLAKRGASDFEQQLKDLLDMYKL